MLVLFLISLVAGTCPAKCHCNTLLKGFDLFDKFYSKCTSCKDQFKKTHWGDGCETPCAEYADDENPDPATLIGKGNCDGCFFDGTCRGCKEGFWGAKTNCKGECEKNCREPSSGKHVCNDEGGNCFGCAAGFCHKNGGCGQECPKNCAALEGETPACKFATCSCDACKNGFFGAECEGTCKGVGCAHCTQGKGECEACKPDYYGDPSDCKKCHENCKDHACNMDGSCKLGCTDNKFWGKQCENACPSTCANEGRCRPDGTCACEPGKFGAACDKECPDGCDGAGDVNAPGVCDVRTGQCKCKPGQWDQQCPGEQNALVGTALTREWNGDVTGICKGDCDQYCAKGCRIVGDSTMCNKFDGSCECEKGFWGKDCDQYCADNCAEGKCQQEKGQCHKGCANNMFGVFCDQHCEEDCKGGTCQQSTGDCACADGYYGIEVISDDKEEATAQCSKACPHCKLYLSASWLGKTPDVCNKQTGECARCEPKMYGAMCEKKCNGFCGGDGSCDRDFGYCACVPGRYGPVCAKCPSDCDGKCDPDHGECEDCTTGKTGPLCEADCPEHCSGGKCPQDAYEQQGKCDKRHDCRPVCAGGCEMGWHGSECKEECATNTAEKYGCTQEDGTSVQCKPDHWGKKCDKVCPDNCDPVGLINCKQLVDESGLGECYKCKGFNFHGLDCSQPCPENCQGGMCEMTNNENDGNCMKGCKVGFWGKKCTDTCPDDCVGGCDQRSGHCKHCRPGMYGPSCSEKCHVRCATCNGPGAAQCTSCDDATNLRGDPHGVGKCKCVGGDNEEMSKRWKEDFSVFGKIVFKKDKCYCHSKVLGPMQLVPHEHTEGSTHQCFPMCPDGSMKVEERCYPVEVSSLAKSGVKQGQCSDGHKEFDFTADGSEEVCVDVITALSMYKNDAKIKPQPNGGSGEKMTVCSNNAYSPLESYAKIISTCIPDIYVHSLTGGNVQSAGYMQLVI